VNSVGSAGIRMAIIGSCAEMSKGVLLINGFGEAIAATPYPNLVVFWRAPDRKDSITPSCLVNPSKSNQRRIIVVRASFDGGFYKGRQTAKRYVAEVCTNRPLPHRESANWGGATFKASSSGRCFSQFDRKTNCIRKVSRVNSQPLSLKRDGSVVATRWCEAFTHTVCGTQTLCVTA